MSYERTGVAGAMTVPPCEIPGFGKGALPPGAHEAESFLEEVQKKMETIVLGRSSGSYDQRILAEFLSELQERANAALGKE